MPVFPACCQVNFPYRSKWLTGRRLPSGTPIDFLTPNSLLILVLAAGLIALNEQRLYSYIRLDLAGDRLNEPARRIENLLTIGIFQRRTHGRIARR